MGGGNRFALKLALVLALLVLGGFIVVTRLSFTGIQLTVHELLEARAEGAAAGAALLLDPGWLAGLDPGRPESAPGYDGVMRRLDQFRASSGVAEVEVYQPEAGGRATVLLRSGRRPGGDGPPAAELYVPWRHSGARSLGAGKIGWYPVRDGSGAPLAVVQVYMPPGEALQQIARLGNTLLLLLLGVALSLCLLAVALLRTLEKTGVYRALLRTLTAAIDARDPYTQGHSARVSANAAAIARRLGLPPRDVERIRRAGLLHDIGKIGVRDAVLLKPGKLTPEEWEALKQHTSIGARIVAESGAMTELLAAIRHHHERIDGRGYPAGLKGDAIPLDARILAVADAFDAMTSDRAYQRARPPEQALLELRRVAGAQVDARVVEALAGLYERGELLISPPEGAQREAAAAQMPPDS